MKKADMRGVRPIIKNRPVLGRLIIAGCLLILPFLWVYASLKETWSDLCDEAREMLEIVFLPWDKGGEK